MSLWKQVCDESVVPFGSDSPVVLRPTFPDFYVPYSRRSGHTRESRLRGSQFLLTLSLYMYFVSYGFLWPSCLRTQPTGALTVAEREGDLSDLFQLTEDCYSVPRRLLRWAATWPQGWAALLLPLHPLIP